MRCWRGLGVGLAAVACPGDAADQVNGLSLLLLIVEEAEVLAAGWVPRIAEPPERGPTAGKPRRRARSACCAQAPGQNGRVSSSWCPRLPSAEMKHEQNESGGDSPMKVTDQAVVLVRGRRTCVRSMALRFYGPRRRLAARMSGSFVIPLGAKRMCANFET